MGTVPTECMCCPPQMPLCHQDCACLLLLILGSSSRSIHQLLLRRCLCKQQPQSSIIRSRDVFVRAAARCMFIYSGLHASSQRRFPLRLHVFDSRTGLGEQYFAVSFIPSSVHKQAYDRAFTSLVSSSVSPPQARETAAAGGCVHGWLTLTCYVEFLTQERTYNLHAPPFGQLRTTA